MVVYHLEMVSEMYWYDAMSQNSISCATAKNDFNPYSTKTVIVKGTINKAHTYSSSMFVLCK